MSAAAASDAGRSAGGVEVAPPPGAEQAKAHPREFSCWVQAGGSPGDGAEVPRDALQSAVKRFGADGQQALPEQLAFDELAARLHRVCTHPKAEGEGNCLGFAARDKSGVLAPLRFERRALRPEDIRIQIAYCGICHSDLHKVKSEWGEVTAYPCVPGHEIVGVVLEVGPGVRRFSVGDRAAVGCMVGSCGECEDCTRGLQQYCARGPVWTYDTEDPAEPGQRTRGGYSTHVVLSERFALHLPASLPMDAAAPLLCAGITTYSPLRRFGLDKPGTRVGVVGLGGLGHMAVKLAKAFGCQVTVISTSPGKRQEALDRLGADHFVVSNEPDQMAAVTASLDGIIDCVSAPHDLAPYLSLLRTDGRLVLVGLPPDPLALPAFSVTARRRVVAGSAFGSIDETQEMLDFCARHSVTCDIELVGVDQINDAMERLERNDVRYRFVIEIARTLVA